MYYFDITEMHDKVSDDLVRRLGFKKVFNISWGIATTIQQRQGKRLIINPATEAIARKAARSKSVVAFVANRNYTKKMLREISAEGKPLIFSARDLIFSDQLIQRIIWNSDLLKRALHYKVKVAIASFARDSDEMRSAEQLIEMAKMLGADEALSKRMLGANGDIHDIEEEA
ncbi:MAG: hypothetical protein QXF41_01785 [Candidatus Micrarchaeaceae archaeon]